MKNSKQQNIRWEELLWRWEEFLSKNELKLVLVDMLIYYNNNLIFCVALKITAGNITPNYLCIEEK